MSEYQDRDDAEWWKADDQQINVEHLCTHCGFSLRMTAPDAALFALFTKHECHPT